MYSTSNFFSDASIDYFRFHTFRIYFYLQPGISLPLEITPETVWKISQSSALRIYLGILPGNRQKLFLEIVEETKKSERYF